MRDIEGKYEGGRDGSGKLEPRTFEEGLQYIHSFDIDMVDQIGEAAAQGLVTIGKILFEGKSICLVILADSVLGKEENQVERKRG